MASFIYKGYRAQYQFAADWSAEIFPPGVIVPTHTVKSPGSKGHNGILAQIKQWIDAQEDRSPEI